MDGLFDSDWRNILAASVKGQPVDSKAVGCATAKPDALRKNSCQGISCKRSFSVWEYSPLGCKSRLVCRVIDVTGRDAG